MENNHEWLGNVHTSTLKSLLRKVDDEMHGSVDELTTEDYMALLDFRNAISSELKYRYGRFCKE